MSIGAFICGCQSTGLSADEIAFIKKQNPWGLILFKRNVESRAQTLALTQHFRGLTGRSDAPVLIDQEGGRVQRLGPPEWPLYPAGKQYGELYRKDPVQGLHTARLVARLMADDLRELGINVNCVPVLDVPQPGGHEIIGDRAYSNRLDEVMLLARAAASGLMEGGVLPVIKHIPGHGRADADSHLSLPVVQTSQSDLETCDFVPFAACADLPMAMTAHVVYSAFDAQAPATLSKTMIEGVIRNNLQFSGLLMTDDMSMKALDGTMTDKVKAAQSAGCDMILHCNGDMAEMAEVAEASGPLVGPALARAGTAMARLREPVAYDRGYALALRDRLLPESV